MPNLGELRAAEREVEREWQWLHDALNTVARARAENGDAQAFRLMQAQAMAVGQRRIELSMKIAAIEGAVRLSWSGQRKERCAGEAHRS